MRSSIFVAALFLSSAACFGQTAPQQPAAGTQQASQARPDTQATAVAKGTQENDPDYGAKFLDCYRLLDALAGKILAKLHSDVELIFLSDHGFTTLKNEVYVNVWLEQNGFLSFDGREKSLGSMSPQTKAFALDPGRIYVNLAGREPKGTVAPEEQQEVVGRLATELKKMQDPDSGESMIGDVYLADEIYIGPQRNRAPDLLIMGRDGYDVKGTMEAGELTGRGKLVGMHKYDNATLFVRGKRIEVEHASVRDVLPTACVLLGLEPPSDLDGRSVIKG